MPDEDLFARLPRAFKPAAKALRDGLVSGYCDPYPLAFGLDQMVARAQGLASLSALVKALPNSAATAQVRLPLEAAPDLDQIDQIEQAHAQNRLDQLAARAARQQIVRGDLDRDRFLCAVAHNIICHFVVENRQSPEAADRRGAGVLRRMSPDRSRATTRQKETTWRLR